MPSSSIASTAQTAQDAVDWQEDIYQKLQAMKQKYLTDLNDMYQKISTKCQQLEHNDSVLNVQKSEQIDRLKMFKKMFESMIQFLNVAKNNIGPDVKDKLSAFEKLLISIVNSNRHRKPLSAQHQIQQPGGHPLPMRPQQQQQQPDNQMNQQILPTALTNMHHGAMPLLSNQIEQCQMYQQWINQQMQYLLQQQQLLQQQVSRLQQQVIQLQQQSQKQIPHQQ